MVFESSHIATSIDAPADVVYAFVTDPRHLSSWASGLAEQEVVRAGDKWIVVSPMGDVTVAFAPTNPFGVADHDVGLPSGEVVTNPMRVIPNGDGCDVVFTVYRREGTTASEVAADVDAVTADLEALRTLMEARRREHDGQA